MTTHVATHVGPGEASEPGVDLRDSDRPTVLVVEPDARCPLDEYQRVLADDGLRIDVVRPYEEPLARVLTADALIVLGGEMGANDDDEYPWLADIRDLQRQAVIEGKPSLGICLGAQLLARAFGGSVRRGSKGLESGLVAIRRRPVSGGDALLAGLPDRFGSAGFHWDEIDELPPMSTWLADSGQYRHQAFRVEDCAWGLQFHAEVSADAYAGWVDLVEETSVDAACQEGLLAVRQNESQTRATNDRLARNFAGIVRQSVASRSAS